MVAKNALLFAALLASSMLFAGMGDWDGQVFINGELAADGTAVCAHVNGDSAENSRTTVGAYASGYYLMTVIGDTGDNVTFNVYCDSNYSANEGQQAWSASPPRHHLNLSINHSSVVGNASNITWNGTGNLSVTINGTAPGDFYSGVQTVNVSSPSGVILSFNYNFSGSYLNFSNINISTGTSGGASYISVSGVNATGGQSGSQTVKLYGVSSSYNGICVKDAEVVTYISVSSTCDGSGEVQVKCDGVAVSGITCSQSGTNLTISGLAHTALIQFSVPTSGTTGTTGGGSNSGGGSAGGGGGASSMQKLDSYLVDIGNGDYCNVTIKRQISSSSSLSTVTNTLENTGGAGCDMTDFAFRDTIPSSFPAIAEITFNPEITSRSGWTVTFDFPVFPAGESKTIAYSVSTWIPPSWLQNFTAYSMSAKKQVAAPAPKPNVTPEAPEVEPPAQVVPPYKPIESTQPAPPPAPAPGPEEGPLSGALVIAGLVILAAVGILAYLLSRKKNEY